ncbi:MAG TPA: 3-oxoacyl-[acyl-carrier-protein] synthase III C-terminal domain-containing protein [Acidimicrobiales bacterium]|nr:3-oxoacyl-[acyl-carrier-protein] synthase III C-terminal domain-containing protein [Acidimicrobiales bacterium]
MTESSRSEWLLLERSPGGPEAPHVARIAGAGRCLPDRHLTTDELMASTRHHTGIDLERLTGIHERRVSDGRDDSLSLAVEAARDCLRRSDREAGDLDAVVSCSITKYRDGLVQWLEPPSSLSVAHALGASRAVTFDVSNACAGMLTGVFILNNWIRRGVIRRGLVVSGEYISQLGRNAAAHVRNIMSRELASLTLGDAGAALLLEREEEGRPGISVTGFTTIADHSRLCLAYPAAHEPGARMFTRSQALQKAAIRDTPPLLQEILDEAGLEIGDVDHVIPHQTSARAIRKGMAHVGEALGGQPRQPAVVTVDHYGNTASTTHTVALIDEMEAGRIASGDHVALLSLASGLVIGVVLFSADGGLVSTHGNTD